MKKLILISMMTFFISSCCDKIRTESEVNARLYNSAKKEIVELNDKTDTLNARLDKATGVENYKKIILQKQKISSVPE